MRRIVKTTEGWGLLDHGGVQALRYPLADMLAGAPIDGTGEPLSGPLVAPLDHQEVWAAGVTYERSRDARVGESDSPDFYQRIYDAERPELFFKSTPERVLGPDSTASIRPDSTWDVPEPEVALVVDAAGEIFGYTVGNDLSSRSIEGENPLYLPQAKMWDGACVLGPWIVPVDDVVAPFDITLTIGRGERVVFEAVTSTSKMARTFDDLVSWLVRHMTFPHGVVLLTGTGIVPDDDVTLRHGDTVTIDVSQIGTLTHGIRTWKR